MFENVLAIIPARRESKRLPDKNKMQFLGGTALWENTVFIARNAGIKKIAISTDDIDILDKTGSLDNELNVIGLKRSNKLSGSDSGMDDVIREVMQQVPQSLKYDTICILQPTSPLLQSSTLKHAFYSYFDRKYPCIVSVNSNYKPCGAFYIFDKDSFTKHGTIWMPGVAIYVVDKKESVDIDYIWDFRIATAIIYGNVIEK